MSFLQGGSSSNYTIGGARIWFNRDVDLTLTPPRREGWKDLGNIVEFSDEQTVDVLDHFTAKSGTRRKDRSLVREISNDILATLDELSTENLRTFFRGGAITDVSETLGVAVTAQVAQMNGTETVIVNCPAGGYNATNIVVKDITGVTTYTVDVEYEEVAITGGYVGIRRIDGSTDLADGDFVQIDFEYDQRVVKRFSPATETEVTGQCMLFGVSDTGNEWIRSMEKVQLEPEGGMSLNSEEWSSFQLRIKILDNTDSVPTAPFGLFDHFGTGQDI